MLHTDNNIQQEQPIMGFGLSQCTAFPQFSTPALYYRTHAASCPFYCQFVNALALQCCDIRDNVPVVVLVSSLEPAFIMGQRQTTMPSFGVAVYCNI